MFSVLLFSITMGFFFNDSSMDCMARMTRWLTFYTHSRNIPFTLTGSCSCFSVDCDSPFVVELDAPEAAVALDEELRSEAVLLLVAEEDVVGLELDC